MASTSRRRRRRNLDRASMSPGGPAVLAAVFALALSLAAGASAQTAPTLRAPCLHYEPELVRLSGTLEHTAAAASGSSGSTWILRLSPPICTTGPDDVNRPERDIGAVELAAHGGMLTQFAALAGGPVTASGTLFHSRDRHPRTAVLMAVRGVSRHAPGDARPQPNLSGNLDGDAKPRPNAGRNSSATRRDERTRSREEAMLDALLRELNERLSPPAALELAALQSRWQDLAERECRWESRVPPGTSAPPSASAACLDRARRDRIRRLRDLVCVARGLPAPCEDSQRYGFDEP